MPALAEDQKSDLSAGRWRRDIKSVLSSTGCVCSRFPAKRLYRQRYSAGLGSVAVSARRERPASKRDHLRGRGLQRDARPLSTPNSLVTEVTPCLTSTRTLLRAIPREWPSYKR